ncbi:MAG: nitroimidazol reductase NimA-like FMN-containing flavoprotein [Saprospiraceae bacterium]|jgi:nitroimidazol reductase NimA-like FMN-containing flavoprotein (pyridoxamine 5'-phosphate oxidase superfamily)
MLGTLTNYEIDQILKSQTLGRIGCSAEGRTYIVPIAYAYDGEYLYGHSPEGMKIKMMRQNPKVCFEVDSMENLANWKSVIIQGEFQELIGEPGRQAMQFFVKQLQPHLLSSTSIPSQGMSHFHQTEQSELKSVVFRIQIHEKTGRFER